MARYIAKRQQSAPRASWYEATPQTLPHPQAWSDDAKDTGLLDLDGNKIMKLPDQIGFVRSNGK